MAFGSNDQKTLIFHGQFLSFLSAPLGLPGKWGTHLPVWEGMPIDFLSWLKENA